MIATSARFISGKQSFDGIPADQREWPALQVVDGRMRIDPHDAVQGRQEIFRRDRVRSHGRGHTIGGTEHMAAANTPSGHDSTITPSPEVAAAVAVPAARAAKLSHHGDQRLPEYS